MAAEQALSGKPHPASPIRQAPSGKPHPASPIRQAIGLANVLANAPYTRTFRRKADGFTARYAETAQSSRKISEARKDSPVFETRHGSVILDEGELIHPFPLGNETFVVRHGEQTRQRQSTRILS
jgi:hypothetical protein